MVGFVCLATGLVLLVALVRKAPGRRLRRIVGWLAPVGCMAVAVSYGHSWLPWQRLFVATLFLVYLLKATVLLRYPRERVASFSLVGLTLFFSLWPGMDPTPFRKRGLSDVRGWRLVAHGLVVMAGGLLASAVMVVSAPVLHDDLLGWLGIGALLTTIHFGYADVLTGALRINGWRVRGLFEDPLRSRSINEFWSRRWNLAFVEMDRILFLRPMRRWLGPRGALFGVYMVSGLLHEFALSYPAGRGWGGPLTYFLLQAVFVTVERWFSRGADRFASAPRGWVWLCVLAPLPLLFHAAFRDTFVVALFRALAIHVSFGCACSMVVAVSSVA